MSTPTIPMPNGADLQAIGAAVLNLVAGTVQLGHQSPAETLDYLITDPLDHPSGSSAAPAIVTDLVAWCSRRQNVVPGAEERLRLYVDACGWRAAQTASLGDPSP